MKYDRLTRRHLLQGLGASLALPVLPSLFASDAAAQAAPAQKSFIGVLAQNGLYRMYGPGSVLMPPTPFDYPTYRTKGFTALDVPNRHTVHLQGLSALAAANGGQISSLIDASFNPLLPKMMMLQGLDYPSLAYAHHHSQFGNADDCARSPTGNQAMASIDRVMAYSPSFYAANPTIKGRGVCFTANAAEGNSGYQGSSNYQNPASPASSAVVFTTPVYANPLTLWDAFFSTGTTQAPPLKKTLVDAVLGDYQALRRSGRLGTEDQQRLDLHIDFLHQTQTRVNALAPVCNALRPASSPTDRKLVLHALNDVIVSLIGCGRCHTFLGWGQSIASSDPESYHVWSHAGYSNDDDSIGDAAAYTSLVEHNRSLMKDLCLDLATKLDALGLLDSSFIACVQEHNKRGHESWNVPVITFGSAGGVFKTGQYLDYRNMADRDDLVFSRFGYPINQFLANTLLAMGVPRTEFEPLNKQSNPLFKASSGYGVAAFNSADGDRYSGHYTSKWQGHDLSDWLPGIKA